MQNSRNTYIHSQQNIFALKALFYIQQLYIYAALKNIYLFTKSMIIRGNYIRSRNYIHFKELISSFNEIIFVQGNIFLQGKHIHSEKLYQFKEYIHLRNIYSFKFRARCSFKEAISIQQRCVRGRSRNFYSKIVSSHFMIIISFTITIS